VAEGSHRTCLASTCSVGWKVEELVCFAIRSAKSCSIVKEGVVSAVKTLESRTWEEIILVWWYFDNCLAKAKAWAKTYFFLNWSVNWSGFVESGWARLTLVSCIVIDLVYWTGTFAWLILIDWKNIRIVALSTDWSFIVLVKWKPCTRRAILLRTSVASLVNWIRYGAIWTLLASTWC